MSGGRVKLARWVPAVLAGACVLFTIDGIRPLSAEPDPCKNIPRGRDIHTFEDSHDQFYLQSKYLFKSLPIAHGQACQWSIEHHSDVKSAVIVFDGPLGSPFTAKRFEMTKATPACSGLPVVASDPMKTYTYTITLIVKKGIADRSVAVDPGIIIDDQAPSVRINKTTGGDWFQAYHSARPRSSVKTVKTVKPKK